MLSKFHCRCLTLLLFCIASHGYVVAESLPRELGPYYQEVAVEFTTDDGLPASDVRAIDQAKDGSIWAETSEGWAVFREGKWATEAAPEELVDAGRAPADLAAGHVRQIARRGSRQVAAAEDGLFEYDGEQWSRVNVSDGQGRLWAVADVRGVAFDARGRLWVATLAGVACEDQGQWTFYTGADGLPYNDFTTVEAGPDGVVWFGTKLGAVRYDGAEWAYRQGPRWLPDDEIRDIVVDPRGNAWFATGGGVGRIDLRKMTLAEKARFYEEEMKLIRRTRYGYVAEGLLEKPGDKSTVYHHDSDNDGLWTAMYGAGECFAYGATGDPAARKRAQAAFEALRFLQKVHEGGDPAPPPGYVARTIVSTDLPDPNEGRLERDRKTRENDDQMWKVYEPRWPKSADGQWYWKSDTSSDELDGHYFFYPLYYDLVAETEQEKERVREVVRSLTDHLIVHGYNLVDHDGTPTRWGYYSPEAMNNDPRWWIERGLKSLSMLSYLSVAYHVTGDQAYWERAEELINDHAYRTNAMIYKIHRGIGSGNHSDDEMAFMGYYNLLKYAPDEALREEILLSFFSAWTNEFPEKNPFFNFAYAAHGLNATYSDQWGEHDLNPWDGWLEDSIDMLQGLPLDRLNWPSQNSHRLDVTFLPRQQATRDITDAEWNRLGLRNTGKVLPVENRHFNHWNNNPYELDYGGNGRVLGSGTVFLLPYYMGLYHEFIQETGNGR